MNNPAASPRCVLIAGGDSDPNLAALVSAFADREVPCETLFVGAQTYPRVTWNFDQDALIVNGIEKTPDAVFLRYDVFTSLADHRQASAFRAQAWFTTISGWLSRNPRYACLIERARSMSPINWRCYAWRAKRDLKSQSRP